MILETGRVMNVWCQDCCRQWETTLDKTYAGAEEFNETNTLQCPWCQGTTKEGTTNIAQYGYKNPVNKNRAFSKK